MKVNMTLSPTIHVGNNRVTSKEAAAFLGYAEKTLRESRVSGTLAGVTAPPYVKRGKFCIYEREDLVVWSKQFKKITHTGQQSV